MKYRVSLNDSMDLLVVADSEVEAVRKAKAVKDAMHIGRVADSSKLRQMAYDLAQLGNYFDRANSAFSRELLSDRDRQKLTEFFNLGTRTYNALKNEVDSIKRAAALGKFHPVDLEMSDTQKLLYDAISRMHWTGDPKLRMLSQKMSDLWDEYRGLFRKYGDASPVKDDNYEKALNQLSPTNKKVFEKIVEESEMLSPGDLGVSKYRETMAKLERFGRTLDISLLKDVARALKSVTGGYYKFDDVMI